MPLIDKFYLANVFAGASDAIKNVLKLLISSENGKLPGVMVPIPQYPLYSASLAEFHMHQIGYYLNEEQAWGLDVPELQVYTGVPELA